MPNKRKWKSHWADEDIDAALNMYKAGKSYSMIAEILTKVLGRAVTRGAIAGLVSRHADKKMHAGRASSGIPPKKGKTGPKKPVPLPKMEIDEPHPPSREVQFNELESGMCKWATSYGFCGHASIAPTKPYCSYHTKRSLLRYEKR